jgi:lysozyme
MNLSPNGLSILKSFESLCLVPYNDKATKSDPNPTSGNATVGYGHLLHRGPLDGTEVPVTEAEALSLLAADVASKAEVWVSKYVTAPLNQNQFDALCIFCFNVGSVALGRVVSETGLNLGNYAAVPAHLLLYNKSRDEHGQLVEMRGLTRRRAAEAELFEKPI